MQFPRRPEREGMNIMSKTRILPVEDEAVIAMEIKSCLEKNGYEVIPPVNNGDAAIEVAGNEKPDLILMDIGLKGDKDGIETADIIRADFGIPFVFITGYLDEAILQRAGNALPFGIIPKPIQERTFKLTLQTALMFAEINARHKNTIEILREENDSLFKELAAVEVELNAVKHRLNN